MAGGLNDAHIFISSGSLLSVGVRYRQSGLWVYLIIFEYTWVDLTADLWSC